MSVYGRVEDLGSHVHKDVDLNDDEWETDPDFENDVGEKGQRYGSKSVEGSAGKKDAVSLEAIKNDVKQTDANKVKEYQTTKKNLYGVSAVEDENFRFKNKS